MAMFSELTHFLTNITQARIGPVIATVITNSFITLLLQSNRLPLRHPVVMKARPEYALSISSHLANVYRRLA